MHIVLGIERDQLECDTRMQGLRSDMENSDLSLLMRWCKIDVELAVSMIPSTYMRRYMVEEP
jgi:hypothetical protein